MSLGLSLLHLVRQLVAEGNGMAIEMGIGQLSDFAIEFTLSDNWAIINSHSHSFGTI